MDAGSLPFSWVDKKESALLYQGHSEALVTRLGGGLTRDDKHFEIIPKVDAYSAKWWHFLDEYAGALFKLSEPQYDGALKTKAGVDPSMVTRLATAPGRPMLPIGDPMPFAAKQRLVAMAEHKLSEQKRYGFSAKEEPDVWSGSLEEEVMAVLLLKYARKGPWSKLRVKNNTNVGLPNAFKSPILKQRIINRWARRSRKISERLKFRKLDELYQEDEMLFANIAQNRVQADSFKREANGLILFGGQRLTPKDRPAFSALSNSYVNADKLVDIEGVGLRGRGRGRPVAGTALTSSLPALYVSHVVQKRLYESIAFKTRRPSELEEVLGLLVKKNFAIYDTVTSDMNQPPAALAQIDKRWLNEFGMAGLFAVLPSHLPLLVPAKGEGAILIGDPFDTDTWSLQYTVASGDPGTTVKTTLLNATHLIAALVRAGLVRNDKSEWIQLLNNGLPHLSVFLVGDNMLISSTETIPDLTPFFRFVPVDAANTIMGLALESRADGRNSRRGATLKAEISNYTAKLWRENAVYSPRARFPGLGAKEQRKHYGAGIMADVVFELEDRLWHQHFGATKLDYYDKYPDPPLEMADLSPEAVRLILDLDRMHYNDIPDRVFEEIEHLNYFAILPRELDDSMVDLMTQQPPDWAYGYTLL